ncbi:hypothetical protein V2J09_022571 [Rumex salicifolius]
MRRTTITRGDLLKFHFERMGDWKVLEAASRCARLGAMGDCQQHVMVDQQVIHFFMGLNESFNAVRANVLMISPPLSLNEVYQLILQEEEQRYLNTNTKQDDDFMALAAQRGSVRDGQKDYSKSSKDIVTIARLEVTPWTGAGNCTVLGHSIERCWKVHGYSSGKGLERLLISGSDSASLTHHQYNQLIGHLNKQPRGEKMTYADFLAVSKPTFITLLYRKLTLIHHISQVQVSPHILLQNVLYVPEFQFNLLSVYKIT